MLLRKFIDERCGGNIALFVRQSGFKRRTVEHWLADGREVEFIGNKMRIVTGEHFFKLDKRIK